MSFRNVRKKLDISYVLYFLRLLQLQGRMLARLWICVVSFHCNNFCWKQVNFCQYWYRGETTEEILKRMFDLKLESLTSKTLFSQPLASSSKEKGWVLKPKINGQQIICYKWLSTESKCDKFIFLEGLYVFYILPSQANYISYHFGTETLLKANILLSYSIWYDLIQDSHLTDYDN